ncbi:C40 family peptidase [Rhodococcus aetherivorans]|uniref:C40 family peptidase n=1 Tax=Rhodococcus aetherivorans TaxID=191292 RepID=UPI002949A81F|nr:C40 family peptidase [Rhodococcus aetherivorans]MDV6296963.1 C40 family peptidase [Rhodococcus aetherivorans]
MAKHRVRRGNRQQVSTTGLLIAGGVTVAACLLPASPAAAEPITIPGIGTFDLPHTPALPPAPTPAPLPVPHPAPLPDTAPSLPPSPSTHGARALAAAESKIGAPYVWAAAGPDAFDCSGLVQWAYQQVGVVVPRTTYDQLDGGQPVDRAHLQPGDLVLFNGAQHVGLYAGNGTVVHAPTTGQPVKQAPLDSMPFYAARRY